WRRVRDGLDEAAFDLLALAEDRVDVAGPDLPLEHGIRHGQRIVRPGEEQPDHQKVHEQDEHEPQPRVARRQRDIAVAGLPGSPPPFIGAGAAPPPWLLHTAAQAFGSVRSIESPSESKNHTAARTSPLRTSI